MSDIVITQRPGSDNGTSVILEWAPVAAAQGYVFFFSTGRTSSTNDGSKTWVRIAKSNLPVTVRALRAVGEGVFPRAASNVPAPPALNNPVGLVCKSGVPNFFDTQGRHAIVNAAGLVEQGPKNENAIVTLKNCPLAIVEGVPVYAANRQSAGVGNGYGYGLYLVNCGEVYVTGYRADGPGLAQAIVMNGCRKLTVVNSSLSPMHPVWHVVNGKPAEVHTDAIQSYGGPGVLELYDTDIVTCGSAIQVQPYKGAVSPMGLWRFHRVDVEQIRNPDSDEMPFCLTKDPGGQGKWPTETVDSYVKALGTTFGVSWVSDPLAWQAGGTWGNTGSWQLGVRP